MIVLVVMVLAAIFAPQVAPYDPLQTSLTDRLKPPAFAGGTQAHLLGTDKLGRDVLSRIICGARVSLSVSLLVILITGSDRHDAGHSGRLHGWLARRLV